MTEPLRVLGLCDWFSPRSGGGAERVAWEVYRRLARSGHEVTVLSTATRSGRAGDFGDLPPGLSVHQVRAVDLSRLTGAQVSHAVGLSREARSLLDSFHPDVVHANSLQFQTSTAGRSLAARHHVPFVITAHIAGLDDVPGVVGTVARVHERTVGQRLIRSARRVIAVSEAVERHVLGLVPDAVVDVVANGVDLERFGGRREGHEPHHPPRLLFIGRLISNKGPEVALRTLALLPGDITLDVVGDGPDAESLRHLVAALGLDDRVRFHGFRDDVERFLGRSDVVLRPSLTEGMPLAVLEAMAAGVPVVATDCPGNMVLVKDGVTGLLAPRGDAVAMARAVQRLADDPALAASIAANARARAATMSWDRCATETLNSLRAAAQGSGIRV